MPSSVRALETVTRGVRGLVDQALDQGGGLLRLLPCWVPRAFLHPGRRLKLDPRDLYAFGLERGGIDERWFASTTEATNAGREPDEGLSYVLAGNRRCSLRDAVEVAGAELIGERLWDTYRRWPVYSKLFDNMGPIPLHLHQRQEHAERVGQEGKPEGYWFPPQHNRALNAFPYTFFGLSPGTEPAQVRRCLERWQEGDNGILDLSQAYRLRPGTGWLVPPGILHAPGSLCTYEPQWGSDVFGMYQNVVEGRVLPWSLLVKDVPPEHREDLDYLIEQIDWQANVDPHFKRNHFLEPVAVADTADQGWLDEWVVYGECNGVDCFSAKQLTLAPGTRVTVRDAGAYGLTVVQGRGRMNRLTLDCPATIRFDQITEDEVFCTAAAARAGVDFENTGIEPLVTLRYFGPGSRS